MQTMLTTKKKLKETRNASKERRERKKKIRLTHILNISKILLYKEPQSHAIFEFIYKIKNFSLNSSHISHSTRYCDSTQFSSIVLFCFVLLLALAACSYVFLGECFVHEICKKKKKFSQVVITFAWFYILFCNIPLLIFSCFPFRYFFFSQLA